MIYYLSLKKKSGKYFKFEVGLELSIRDIYLINYIKAKLGVGTIFIRKSANRSEMVIFRVRSKQDLKEIIIPIFDKYPLLTNKQYDYIRFKVCLLSESNDFINAYTNKKYIRPLTPVNTVDYIINVPYFSSWLIGFIESEGCFSIYKPSNDNSLVASFEISKTNEETIIQAIAIYLSLSQKVHKNKVNSFRLKVSSVDAVNKIIIFIQNAPTKLLGYKKVQYISWLESLKSIDRYSKKITIPDNY